MITSKHSTVRAAVTALVCTQFAKWLCNFENLADLKFLSPWFLPGTSLPFDIYFRLGFGSPDTYQVLPCEALKETKLLHESQQPLLFKGCVYGAEKKSVVEDLAVFPESITTLFPDCDANGEENTPYQYEDVSGNVTEMFERQPCGRMTLADKIEVFQKHRLDTNGAYFDTHVAILNGSMEKKLVGRLVDRGYVPDGFKVGLGDTLALTHFFSAGQTAVDYYHSHPERSLTFGMDKTKVWELINPRWIDNFVYEYSGKANIPTREKVAGTPVVIVEQEPGDIMLLPNWWLHKTQHQDSTYSISPKAATFNIHFLTPRSAFGMTAFIFVRNLGLHELIFKLKDKDS